MQRGRMLKSWAACGLLALGASLGCGGSSPEEPSGGAGGNATGGGSGGSAATDAAASSSESGGAIGSTTSDNGSETSSTGAEQPTDPVELPPGSQEYEGIVNLVDAGAAQQLDQFLLSTEQTHVALRQGLTESVNLFLEHYVEDYDFVFIVTDHVVEGVALAGKFEAVNRPAVPGGGSEVEVALGGYRSTGRLKGAIGIPYRENYYPPLAHEMAHYWAVHLDTRFGFGDTLERHWGPHWGLSGVHGQLGGFDEATLRCQTPAGEEPPNCTDNGDGRTSYVVGLFAEQANGGNIPFAPLELYLMGLAPASEVPESFLLLTDGAVDENSYDEASDTLVVEASGSTRLPFADILARHGEMELLPDDERNFRAAFVVISESEPASDQVLADVARWAAVFGNRESYPTWTSFEENAGGLATLDTTLGPRRDTSDPAIEPRERFVCSVAAQDCGRPELGCYARPPAFCALSGGVAVGEACDAVFACAPGSDCFSSTGEEGSFVCSPYCDPESTSSQNSCSTLCSSDFVTIFDENDVLLGGLCLP